jgi:hypothetical protein
MTRRSDAASLRRALLGLLLVAPMVVSLGCEEELPSGTVRKVVKIETIPAAVIDAGKKAIPGATFDDGWQNLTPDGKLHSYEIRGKAANGKTREVRVAPDGKILERE